MTTTVQIPTCPYCSLLLSDNDRDPESGNFYSCHWTCQEEDPKGEFVVITRQNALPADHKGYENVRRYSTRCRAVEMALTLRAWNRREWACGKDLDITVARVIA